VLLNPKEVLLNPKEVPLNPTLSLSIHPASPRKHTHRQQKLTFKETQTFRAQTNYEVCAQHNNSVEVSGFTI